MNSENVNKWLTLTANLAVLVGIVFLALEIQQANRIAISTTELEIRQNFISLNEFVLTNDGVANILAKATHPDAEFTDAEIEKAYAYCAAAINVWVSIEIGFEQGLVSIDTLKMVNEDITSTISYYPALGSYYRDFLDDYPSYDSSQVMSKLAQELETIGH